MKSTDVQENRPMAPPAPRWPLPALAIALLGALAAGGCGFKTPPRPAVEALPPTAEFQVRQRGEALLVSWRAVEPEAAERFGGVRGYRFLLQRFPVFCGVCPPDSTREVRVRAATLRAVGSGLARERGRLTYRLAGKIGGGGAGAEGPALLRVRMVTLYGSGENRPTVPVLLEPPAPMDPPRLMWRWKGANQAQAGPPDRGEALLYWEPKPEGVLRVIGAGGRPRERETFLRANLYRRNSPAPWPLTPLNPEPLDTGRWSVIHSGGDAEYVLRWIDRSGNEGPPSTPVGIGQPGNSR